MLRTVQVPDDMTDVFASAEAVVRSYFSARADSPERGTIEISGERYVLVRAAALSVEFVTLIRSLYGEGQEAQADELTRNLLFDLSHALGKSDAKNFHARMHLDDPVARLSAGPVHFAFAGWARVDISAESRPVASEDFYLLYDHPQSFEADAWNAAGRSPGFPACVMNAGYSSGWCEESFGVPLLATEILCRSLGDEACRFVMAHPERVEQEIERYRARRPGLAERIQGRHIPDLFARKRVEEALRRSRDELDARVRARTVELERANEQLKAEMVQRAEAEHRLARAQRLEAVGRLAGGVAHDFNNILGVVLGRSSMIQARIAQGDPLWDDLEAIRVACRQGSSLTRHMITFSRSDAAIATPVELNEVVRGLSRGTLALLGEDIELILDLAAADVVVRGDPSQLEQVVVNLAVNARAAMPNGGTLRIRTAVEDIEARSVSTGELRSGTYAVLEIADSGIGMDGETQARMFDPFFSTRDDGTGLGLSTVYAIVARAGGGIAVTSSPANGTIITAYLPRSEETAPEATVPSTRPRGEVARGSARILLVEDRDELRDTMEVALIDAGHRVMAVRDAELALALVEKGEVELDVLVTDLVMPKLGGRELAARVIARRPDVRVLYVSGYDRHGPDDAAAPRAPLLRKPFSIEELTQAVSRLLGGEG